MMLNVHRNHKAYWGRAEGGGEGVLRVREEGDDIPIATLAVTTRMTAALRWAAMRATLILY